jgi:hypothetical protein
MVSLPLPGGVQQRDQRIGLEQYALALRPAILGGSHRLERTEFPVRTTGMVHAIFVPGANYPTKRTAPRLAEELGRSG